MTVMSGLLEDRVAEILTRYSMRAAEGKIGVAVSGGADSVVLLHLLHRLGYETVVLHVNHRLRGAESDEDEVFVRALGAALGSKVEVAQAPVGVANLEQEAREARRRFFLEAMGRLSLKRVALGHSRTDQAETVLYRFLRGSGLSGLAGMRVLTPEGFVRPLLMFSREEIRSWARAEGIEWREDSSNANDAFARNRIRHNIMPALADQFNARLEEVLAANAMVAQAEEDWWDLRIEAIYQRITKRNKLGSFFQIADLDALSLPEQRRLLRKAVLEVKGNLRSVDLQHIEAIRKLIQNQAGHERVLIPGVDALRSFGTLLLTQPGRLANEPRHYLIPVKMGEESLLPFGLGSLYVNWVKAEGRICANFGEEGQGEAEKVDLDGDAVFLERSRDLLHARNWEPGDEMGRTGAGKPAKLKFLFQEHRVLLWERRSWPVLVAGDEIVWSRGFGCAAKFRARVGSRNILRLLFYKAAH